MRARRLSRYAGEAAIALQGGSGELMILRTLAKVNGETRGGVRPAAPAFIESQRTVDPPVAVIFQAEHSELAGQLARALREEIFGDLPPDVLDATAQHDFGWQLSEEGQLRDLPYRKLRPFPDLSVAETLPSWDRSVEHAGQLAPLIDVLVSRHFCLLGAADPERAPFIKRETDRRTAIERVLPYTATDLDRWTGAVGFCDLLSLYLCSGCQEAVEFPFAHPASPAASDAPKTVLRWVDGAPAFEAPVLRPGSQLSLTVRIYAGEGDGLAAETLAWEFPAG